MLWNPNQTRNKHLEYSFLFFFFSSLSLSLSFPHSLSPIPLCLPYFSIDCTTSGQPWGRRWTLDPAGPMPSMTQLRNGIRQRRPAQDLSREPRDRRPLPPAALSLHRRDLLHLVRPYTTLIQVESRCTAQLSLLSLSLARDLFFSRTMHRLGATQACGHRTRPSHPWANVDQHPGSLDFCSSCVVHQKPTLSSKTHFVSGDFHHHPWIPTANR